MAEPLKQHLKAISGWSRKEIKTFVAALDYLCPEDKQVCEIRIDFDKCEMTIEGITYQWHTWKGG